MIEVADTLVEAMLENIVDVLGDCELVCLQRNLEVVIECKWKYTWRRSISR